MVLAVSERVRCKRHPRALCPLSGTHAHVRVACELARKGAVTRLA